jgi:hypothetical protein
LQFTTPTQGGGNKVKVQQSTGGFGISKDRMKWDYTLLAEPPNFTVTPSQASMTTGSKKT